MKIRIFGELNNSKIYMNIYERVFEINKIINSNNSSIKFTLTDREDYTHVIILNTYMPNIYHIPKENVIGLAYEPPKFLNITPEFIIYAQKHIGKYFIGDKNDLPLPFIEHYSYLWHATPLSYIPLKNPNKIMSIIISYKTENAPGYKYRHELIKEILNTNLPIDIYGNGCKLYQDYKDIRIKGEFKNIEPYESYDYHIAIENFQTNHYFSEKIINSLLCSTIPIYLGCRNIETYFPENVISLSGNISEDMLLLKSICDNPSKYKKNIDLSLIKKKTNLLLNIESLF